jgi:hypothetical protein
MRSSLAIALALALAACARPMMNVAATPPIRPDSDVAAALEGTWYGTVDASDSVGAFSLTQLGSIDGTVVGRLAFSGSVIAPAEVKLVEATDSSYVALVGPYFDPALDADVIARIEGRVDGDKLQGTFYTQPIAGGRVTKGKVLAVRAHAPSGDVASRRTRLGSAGMGH